MADTTVTNADVESLAGKLESISEQFTEQEQATLHALFGLAAMGVEAATSDVSGFGVGGFAAPSFRVNIPGTNGILIGLNKSFGSDGGAGHVGMIKIDLIGDKY